MVNLTTEEAIKELSRYTNQEFYTPQNREAHRMAIEALERSQWIPVGERLPETTCLCIVSKFNVPFLAWYTGKEWRMSSTASIVNGVTHWMTLPESPGKEGA